MPSLETGCVGVGVGVDEVVQGVEFAGRIEEAKVVGKSGVGEETGYVAVDDSMKEPEVEETLYSPVEDVAVYSAEVDSAGYLPVDEATTEEDTAVE